MSLIIPVLEIRISTLNVYLSTLSFKEQTPLAIFFGNIGKTELNKYAVIPLFLASKSSGLPSCI